MDPLLLIAVAVWSFAVAAAGGLVGLVLGNLRLPLIVLVASSPAAGAGANVAISGVAALTAAVTHARAGRLLWRLFRLMAPASLVGAVIGGVISGLLPDRILLGAISVLVLYGAVEVWRRQYGVGGDAERRSRRELALNAALIGFAVGLVGGIVGLILGSLRLPAMLRWTGVGPHAAVGTNAAVGVVVGIGGLIGHLSHGVDWGILAAGCAGSVPGAYAGSRLTGRLGERVLLRAIAFILVLSGTAMAVQALLG